MYVAIKNEKKSPRLEAGGGDHLGKYSQDDDFLEDGERADPPRLNAICPEDMRRLKEGGMSEIYEPDPETADTLAKLFRQSWDLFYEQFCDKNGKPWITGFFVWDQKTSTGDFALPADAICNCWGDHCAVGIGKTALQCDDDYLSFLIIHEIGHAITGTDHDEDYEHYLSYMLLVYNEKFGTDLKNDYSGFNQDGKIITGQMRLDHRPMPEAWLQLTKVEKEDAPKMTATKKPTRTKRTKKKHLDSTAAAPQKREKNPKKARKQPIDDSAAAARQRMIQRGLRTAGTLEDGSSTEASECGIAKTFTGARRTDK